MIVRFLTTTTSLYIFTSHNVLYAFSCSPCTCYSQPRQKPLRCKVTSIEMRAPNQLIARFERPIAPTPTIHMIVVTKKHQFITKHKHTYPHSYSRIPQGVLVWKFRKCSSQCICTYEVHVCFPITTDVFSSFSRLAPSITTMEKPTQTPNAQPCTAATAAATVVTTGAHWAVLYTIHLTERGCR